MRGEISRRRVAARSNRDNSKLCNEEREAVWRKSIGGTIFDAVMNRGPLSKECIQPGKSLGIEVTQLSLIVSSNLFIGLWKSRRRRQTLFDRVVVKSQKHFD